MSARVLAEAVEEPPWGDPANHFLSNALKSMGDRARASSVGFEPAAERCQVGALALAPSPRHRLHGSRPPATSRRSGRRASHSTDVARSASVWRVRHHWRMVCVCVCACAMSSRCNFFKSNSCHTAHSHTSVTDKQCAQAHARRRARARLNSRGARWPGRRRAWPRSRRPRPSSTACRTRSPPPRSQQ
jgi:hypothetical protein